MVEAPDGRPSSGGARSSATAASAGRGRGGGCGSSRGRSPTWHPRRIAGARPAHRLLHLPPPHPPCKPPALLHPGCHPLRAATPETRSHECSKHFAVHDALQNASASRTSPIVATHPKPNIADLVLHLIRRQRLARRPARPESPTCRRDARSPRPPSRNWPANRPSRYKDDPTAACGAVRAPAVAARFCRRTRRVHLAPSCTRMEQNTLSLTPSRSRPDQGVSPSPQFLCLSIR